MIDKDIDPAYFFDIPRKNIKGIHIVNLYMDSDKARFLVKRDGTVRYLGRTGYIKKSFKFKKIGERKITYENRKPKA